SEGGLSPRRVRIRIELVRAYGPKWSKKNGSQAGCRTCRWGGVAPLRRLRSVAMPGMGIVTGGARGIGLAVVRGLLDQGVVDRVHVLDVAAAEEDIERVDVHQCDVTDEQ